MYKKPFNSNNNNVAFTNCKLRKLEFLWIHFNVWFEAIQPITWELGKFTDWNNSNSQIEVFFAFQKLEFELKILRNS